MQLVGGTAYHPKLTKKLLTDDPQEYAVNYLALKGEACGEEPQESV